MKVTSLLPMFICTGLSLTFSACNNGKDTVGKLPASQLINDIDLKRGDVIFCGPPVKQFGTVAFDISCKEVEDDFNFAMLLLHSFEYDEAEKVFARIIDKEPSCAMAYWGVAMSNFHPLWAPPTEPEIIKGTKAIAIAKSLSKSTREEDYINAIDAFYTNWRELDHRTRCNKFEKAMEAVHAKYSADKEAGIFYALALTAAADPTDKTFAKQKKAGDILNGLYPSEPDHPGIVHYIIHTNDYPELAERALPAARKYAALAPSSAHALHMPSHIFTRLGLWDDCIQSNKVSVSSAQCYADSSGIKGHWDEELHGLDYLTYAYLQKGDNTKAKEQWDYLKTIREVSPVNFKVAYAFASIPTRYLLENKLWQEAAAVDAHLTTLNWEKFPWQKAILHFTRALGSVHSGNLPAARTELKKLLVLKDTLLAQKDAYKANQVDIQAKTAEAWILFKEGKTKEAAERMSLAADMEDNTQKHPVTPGEVLPARELLGDMLLAMNKPGEALVAYEADLRSHPNRFNAIAGAAIAAEKSKNKEKANRYYKQLLQVAGNTNSSRQEIAKAKGFLAL